MGSILQKKSRGIIKILRYSQGLKILKNYIDDDDKKILIAEINDSKIIGLISLVFLSRLNQKTLELYVPELIVSQHYQNQGIGKKLLNSSIELGKEKKYTMILEEKVVLYHDRGNDLTTLATKTYDRSNK